MFKLFTRQEKSPDFPVYLYNSKSQKEELFTPLQSKKLRMYSCGPTVYDHIHIGNLRAYLVPDLVQRLFTHQGYEVETTINFTDFGHLSDDGDAGEDKMMRGLKREGLPITLESMRNFALPYIESFKRDNIAFGNLPATTYARASDYIEEQIKLIETLEQKGYTYQTSDGVYFEVAKFPEYGQMGNINLEALRAGARVEVNQEKKHPADFALWKNGELGWKSKWGQGFPGWHIECTAMAFATLGKQLDVHTGGEDLMYTHHNGEIAQAECATGRKYVTYWLHNAHVTINNDKLAKSAGNGLRLEDIVDRGYSPLDYRYWLLQSHYRARANFSFEALEASKQALLRLRHLVYEDLYGIQATTVNAEYAQKLFTAMAQDLNTPQALAHLWEVTKDKNLKPGEILATIHLYDSLLGLGLAKEPDQGRTELGFIEVSEIPAEIQQLLEEREIARVARNWPEADRIREVLTHRGYTIEDTSSGPRLSKL